MVKQLPCLTGSAVKGRALTAFVALISGVGFMLFGYDQGVMSGLFQAGQFAAYFPRMAETPPFAAATGGTVPENAAFDSTIQGAVTGIYEIGAMVGSLIVLWKGDAIGRRSSIAIGAVTMIIGTIIMTAVELKYSESARLTQFAIGRVVTGLGNGLNTSTIPMWQSELSKAHNRGLLVLIEGALIAGGIMISYWIDYGFYWIDNSSVQWQFPIAFQCAFAIVLLLGILCLPESPRWLVKKGHHEQAAKVLAQLDNTTTDDAAVQTQLRQLQESIGAAEEIMGDFSYKELLQNGPEQNFYRTTIAFVAQAFQQLSGINLITYYAATVFASVQPENKTARLLTCGNGTEYFLASLVALFMIDTLGRRNLMMWTAFGMSASMAVLAGTVKQINDNPGVTLPESYVASVFLYLFNTFFALGWLGMTWLYPPEVTNIRIRAPASAIATSSNWLFNFLIVMITPVSFASIQWRTYLIFTVLNACFIPVIYIFFVETKRRSLEELDLIFSEAYDDGKGSFFKWSHFMTTACYLSLHKKLLSSEELDAELAKKFGEDHITTMRSRLSGKNEITTGEKGEKASAHDEDSPRDNVSSHSGSHQE